MSSQFTVKQEQCKAIVLLALKQTTRTDKEQEALYLVADEIDFHEGNNKPLLSEQVNKTWKVRNCSECDEEMQVTDPEKCEGDMCDRCDYIFHPENP